MPVDMGRALMGLGAAVGGQAPQFRQQMMQEDELARRRSVEDEAAAEKRRQTLFLDAAAGKQFLDAGDISGFQNLMQDRYNILSKIDGVDASHTKRFLDLANAAGQNRVGAADRLRTEIDNTVKAGQAYKMFGEGASEVPSAFRAKELQAEAAGLRKGTAPYQEFMLYGGAVRDEGGKAVQRFKNGSYMQITPTGNRVYDTAGIEVKDPAKRQQVMDEGFKSGQVYEGGLATAKELGTAQGERINQAMDSAITAAERIPDVKDAIDLLDSVKTGGINRFGMRMRRLLGTTPADEAELVYLLDKTVLSQLKTIFGAQFTEKEGRLLRDIEAGSGKSTEANKALLTRALEALEERAARGKFYANDFGNETVARDIENSANRDWRSYYSQQQAGETPIPSGGGTTPPVGGAPRVINFDAQGNRIDG